MRDQDFATLPGYRMRIYQLGNNADFHLPIYRMVWQAPGLIVLHDLALDDFVRGLQTSGDRLGFIAIREALEARELMTLPDARANPPLRIPWIAAAARRARGIVVHAEFCRRYLEQIGCRTPIFVIPHPPVEGAAAIAGAAPTGARLRAAAEARGARTLVVAAGDVNEAKQLDGLLAAVASLPDDVHVAVVGRTVETYDFAPVAAASGLGHRLHVATDVSDVDFLGMATRGRRGRRPPVSAPGRGIGSLARAMQVGRPTIVSATGTYLDSPPGTVVTVAPGPPDPAELAARIAELASDRELRERIGDDAPGFTWRVTSQARRPPAATPRRSERRSGWSTIRGPHDAPVGRRAGRSRGRGGRSVRRGRAALRAGPGKLHASVMSASSGAPGPLARLALTSGFAAAHLSQGVSRSPP